MGGARKGALFASKVCPIAPTFAAVPQAWLTARLSGAKAWLHVQDFELDAAFRLGIAGGDSNFLHRILQAIERGWMRRFGRVSAISESMRQRLLEKGVEEAKTVLFPNWADLEPFKQGGGHGPPIALTRKF